MLAERVSGRVAAGKASGKASGKAGGSGKGGGEPPRAVVTGMEGLEGLFRAPYIYPAYAPGGVQAMHSGERGRQGCSLAAGWAAKRRHCCSLGTA